MRTVLLTGASGLVGTWLRRTAPADLALTPTTFRRSIGVDGERAVDLRDATATAEVVRSVRPAIVLHAAYDKDEASIVGATGNVLLAAADVGAGVVLLSTDAVFSGDGTERTEGDEPDPVTDYGRWKLAAERAALRAGIDVAIVRLPLVVSVAPDDASTAAVRAGDDVVWFTDEIRRPAMADDLARGVWRICALDRPARAGVWHLAGPETLSRAEIARRSARAIGRDPDASRTSSTPPHVVRPRHLLLGSPRARATIGWAPRAIFTSDSSPLPI